MRFALRPRGWWLSPVIIHGDPRVFCICSTPTPSNLIKRSLEKGSGKIRERGRGRGRRVKGESKGG
jgi:hypothetical protein